MNMLNVTDDYNDTFNNAQISDDNGNIFIIPKHLLGLIPSGVILISLISLIKYRTPKPLLTKH